MTRISIASNRQVIEPLESYNIVMLGAGNVATHLARNLQDSGHSITSVFSRSKASVEALAGALGVPGTSVADEVPCEADFYLIAVPDAVVGDFVQLAHNREGIWLHTAGALPLDTLNGTGSGFGVLYPLQTLSKNRIVSLENSPFLIEGSTPETTERIRILARSISGSVHVTDSQSRLVIHLAAVFANNFSNHMVRIAHQVLSMQNLDPELLLPILKETVRKVEEMGPADAQTGPALRDDHETMQKHLSLLKEHPEWEKLYTFISRDIQRSRKNNSKN